MLIDLIEKNGQFHSLSFKVSRFAATFNQCGVGISLRKKNETPSLLADILVAPVPPPLPSTSIKADPPATCSDASSSFPAPELKQNKKYPKGPPRISISFSQSKPQEFV